MAKPFHLAWFGNFTTPEWNGPYAGNDPYAWTNGDFYVDMARSLERAGFDYFMIEDSLMVSDIYGGTAELELKHARYAPKHDPMPLIPLMAKATKHMGFIATASATFYPPFMLARMMSTLDHLTEGRVGWNIVTSSEDRAAQNFGYDKLPEHDLRYEMAAEYVDIVTQLWDAWAPDAVVMDPETGRYADHTKVHPINYRGKFHSVRGPLNTLRSPQGRPVICQAGGSPKGRAFAARNADTLLAIPAGVAEMKAYRDDIRARAAEYGRNPDDLKVMFVVTPILGATEEEAQQRKAERDANLQYNLELQLVHMAAIMEIDMSPFGLDEPLPDHITTNGHQSSLNQFLAANQGKTLREAASEWRIAESVELVGTPASVADQMEEVMDEVGGDGFLFFGQPVSRRYLNEICEGLAPALQKKGLVRTTYDHKLFRDNLLAF
jgi:FMN-dependent oxidoreductase (nitrilotriacetate monooxygenase family)